MGFKVEIPEEEEKRKGGFKVVIPEDVSRETEPTPYDPPDWKDDDSSDIEPIRKIGATRSFEPLPYEERVQEKADILAQKRFKSEERDPSLINKALAPARQFIGTMAAHLNEALPYKLPGMINKAIPEKVKTVGATMARATPGISGIYAGIKAKDVALPAIAEKAAPIVEKMPEKVKNLAGIGIDIAQMIPATYGGSKIGSKGIQGTVGTTGDVFKGAGKRIEKSVLGKGSKGILKKQGTTLDKAVTGALEHGLGGNMETVLNKSREIIDELEDNISKVTKGYKGNKKVNVEYQFYKAKKYVSDHPELFVTNRPEVEAAIDAQEKILNSYGITGNISVDKAQQIKRWMKVKGMPNQSTPAQQDAIFGIRMAFADNVKEIVPEIDKFNKTYREIMPALKIAAERLPTEQARDVVGLGTLGASGLGAMFSGGVGAGRIPLAIAGNLAYQGSKSGKVAQGLYNIGKGIKKLESLGNKRITMPADRTKTVGNLLKNQKGSIGGISDDIIGTPAIRDPKTGKIYKGGYRGHKDAIIKGENNAVQERLKWEHFLDNANKQTPNVGFINKKGEFISRAEAEKIMNQPKSLAQQFHTLGIMAGTGGIAAGGLTAYEKLKGKNKE
jgi:hypothetical protein